MSRFYAKAVDANQAEIVKALRAAGASVEPLHRQGKGCPDLMIGWRGHNILAEAKDGTKPPSARKLTPDEELWHASWRGQVAVVNTVDEALALIGVTRASE